MANSDTPYGSTTLCGICGNEGADPGYRLHERCSQEWWRRWNDGKCVRCGLKPMGQYGNECNSCSNNVPYIGYYAKKACAD